MLTTSKKCLVNGSAHWKSSTANTHPAVVEAAIGIERDGLVSTKAFVEVRGTGSPELAAELQDHVRHTLAKYKYPREVEFVDALPRNDRGKVNKKGLPRD